MEERYRQLDYDVEAVFTLLPTDAGGRKGPAKSGYRPDHLIKPDYLTCGLHLYLDCEWLQPGESATTLIKFIAPADYPHSVWPGKKIAVQEGARIIGHAIVVKVLNPLLAGEPSGQS